MGTFSSWSYTATCTVWEPAFDEFDQPSSYTRTVYSCSFQAGGNLQLDDQAERFMPQTTFWLEADDDDAPKVGSYIVTGTDASATPPSSSEVIRVAQKHDPSLFDEGTPDRVIMTG